MAIVSYAKQFIFIHIPKCGGSSIEKEWARHAGPTDVLVTFENFEQQKARYGIGQHAQLRHFVGNARLGNVAGFETCAIVRQPLKVVESFYKYGLRNLDSAARAGLMHAPAAGRSYEDWVAFVRDKLASGDTTGLPKFVASLSDGVVREAMLSDSFDEFLERVADQRWERYLRTYTALGDNDVAVKTILRLEDPIAIRKYFKVRLQSGFQLVHNNQSGFSERIEWSKPMRRRYNELTEAEHKAFGYEIVE